MRAAASTGRERSLHYCPVHYCGDPDNFERPAPASPGQPGYMRADRHAADGGFDSAQSERDVTAMNVLYPFQFDGLGRTASAGDDQHIRDLIEQVLFTAPGERVNRPDFGCGLRQLVFATNSQELASTAQFVVQSSLQQWLGDLIQVNEVQVDADDSSLDVTVQYIVRRTGQQQSAQFIRGGAL
jgi:phage baseplate assembly protein W